MRNRISFGFIFLCTNLLVFGYFYYWVITPMWYSKIPYHPVTSNLNEFLDVKDKDVLKEYKKYKKKLDQMRNSAH